MTMAEKNLVQKIAEASIAVGGKLAYDKRNQEQRYDYVSADAILAIGGQALAQAGVVVMPAIMHEVIEVGQTSKGYPRFDAIVEFDMLVTDGVSDLRSHWIGRGSDFSAPDKALYKAITSGHKYFLSKLLCVGAGNEDGEHEDVAAQPAKRQAAPAPKMTAAQALEDLGYDPGDVMSLETALDVVNSEGVRYGDIESEVLANMSIGIGKALRKRDIDEGKRSELELKRDAIGIILRARANNENGAG